MPIEVLMPALSPTMKEGNLVKWHKKEGDSIESGEVLAEIETDKATMEVEAVDEGTLGKILVAEGTENVTVNAVIALILEEGEKEDALSTYQVKPERQKASAQAKGQEQKNSKSSESSDEPSEKIALDKNETTDTSAVHETKKEETKRVFASPLARRIATQNAIDLESLSGSGPRGRIIKADIEKALKEPPNRSPLKEKESSPVETYEDKPLTSMRKVIARRLVESKQTVPHFYVVVDCSFDALATMRTEINAHLEGEKITVNDCMIKALGMALNKVPEANAIWLEDKIRYFKRSDVAVAVALEEGLITPIVTSVESKSLRTVSREIKDLIQKAKAGTLKPEEFQGGSFSLSNLGMYGIREFSAIINPPQAGIIAIGAPQEGALDSKENSKKITVTLSADHRVIDGKVAADLINAFKKYIENPVLLLA